jgi:hypothetical protein
MSPTFQVLQSLTLALALPHPHIRSLRDGSAAVGGPDTTQGFAAVACVVGASICVLVSSAGGCCSAQLPLILSATADVPCERAKEEAWRQVCSAAARTLHLCCKTSHFSPCSRQLLQQARAVISPNSISEAAATALSEVASHVNELAQDVLSRDPTLSQLGDAALLAAAVMCICRSSATSL